MSLSIDGFPAPIDHKVTEWGADSDTSLPINGSDIPGFVAWVNGNGFNYDCTTRRGHDGFDFGAYLRDDGTVVIGLPKETPVRAVANGVVRQVLVGDMTGGAYGCLVNVEHGEEGSGMFSGYVHVEPRIYSDTIVEKGDVIGTLHRDSGTEEGRLVHLHLSLVNGWNSNGGGLHNRLQDPALIDPSIYDLTPETQDWKPFDPRPLGAKALYVANFDVVRVNNQIWMN